MEEELQTSNNEEQYIDEESRIVFFAETNFRNKRTKFGIKKDDRRRHMYIIGKTGMGKSTMMENMIIQDIINGEGVALVDPHGDFAEKILDYVPNSRINDVVYFNPADIDFPIAFNVMESVSQEHTHLVASGLIGVFKKLWADSWGPRLEYVLRNAILALLDYPGSTMLGVMRMLADKNYRSKVIEKIKDPVVKAFWVDEFSRYSQQFQVEATAPIQNKVGQFLSTALIRNVVGQVKSTIDIREIMDNRKILIMNLSKGRIGEDASSLLGAMMITKIQLAAMSRIDTEEKNRKDFYLYVDEFQNFATDSFASILSEARKYRLNLIIGHQYIEQLEETVRAAVFGNVGSLVCFRVGSADGEFLKIEFAPYFTEEDLVNLTKYDIYLKLMIDGVASSPFSATTLPPPHIATNNKDKVIKVSRERYAKPRDVVEDKISRWSGVYGEEEEINTTDKPKLPVKQEKVPQDHKENSEKQNSSKKKKQKTTYKVNCYECGKETEVTFKPDGVRPIYCQTCFQKIKDRGPEQKSETAEKVQEVESISLAEALKKGAVSFDNKKQRNDKAHDFSQKKLQKENKPSSNDLTKEQDIPKIPEDNSKNIEPFRVIAKKVKKEVEIPKNEENIISKPQKSTGQQIVEPGTVVKL